MLLTLLLFFGSAIAIYLACEYFVNGIEWCGKHLKLGATAVGSVLAAFGTALPESAVTLTAVVFGDTPEQKAIGVGAAMGGPLVLATIAYGIVGLTWWLNRCRMNASGYRIDADGAALSKDQLAFLVLFVVKVSLGLIAFAWKPWLGALFLAAYGFYVWREITSGHGGEAGEDLEPLKLRPSKPDLKWAALQAAAALAVIAVASHVFVSQLETIGHFAGLPSYLVALLLSPVATELPETMNAIIWVRQGKARLALANISGAMMIQASIPAALGLFFTPWRFDSTLLAAGIVTGMAMIAMLIMFRRGHMDARALAGVGLLYGLFAGWLVLT